MYQKTLILLDWIIIFCVYFLALLTTSFSGLIVPRHLDNNTVDTFLNLIINTVIGLIFTSFLVYLIKRAKKTPISSYIWLMIFFIITVSLLFKVEITRERLHFAGYGIISLVLYRALRHKIGTKMLYVWISVIIMVFAILDETLQGFVAMGSSFDLKDIGLDWLSGLLAQFLIAFVARPKLKDIDIKIRKGMDRLERMKDFELNHKGKKNI